MSHLDQLFLYDGYQDQVFSEANILILDWYALEWQIQNTFGHYGI